MINDLFIIDYFVKNLCLLSNRLRKDHLNKYPQIIEYLENRYEDSTDFVEIIYRIYHHIDIKPVCKTCGNPISFFNFKKGYAQYCSLLCRANNDEYKNHYKLSSIEKYGCEHPMQNKEILKKSYENNCLNHNGIFSAKTQECQDKSKETCKLKYGVEYSFLSENNKEKSKVTCFEHFGVEYPGLSKIVLEKAKLTDLKIYGAEYHIIAASIKNKSKETCILRFGVDNYFKTELAKILAQTDEAKYKGILTKIKNGTINTSKIEKLFKDYLQLNFSNDFEYQYKSLMYPFNCDFYIKSLNLYIEILGSLTHGGHPYDKNSEADQNTIKLWKSKNTKYYDNAIKIWSVTDVNKRNIAKENNLNYLEIFSNNVNAAINIFKLHISQYI